jgi:ABC-type nickel/cobalt efflux system permease component RcnA
MMAHPLDISSSTYTVYDTRIEAITYFHPSQVELILGKSGVNMRNLTYADYYWYSSRLYEYLKQRISMSDWQWVTCELQNFSTRELGVDEIFTKWFPVAYSIVCQNNLNSFAYSIKIFIEQPLQTNRVLLYEGSTWNALAYKVLTSRIPNARFASGMIQKLIDTDGDWISDEEEVLYQTDAQKVDTDADYYTDYEEVMLWWNPISKELSPGQTERSQYPETPFELPSGIAQHAVVPSSNQSYPSPALDNTSNDVTREDSSFEWAINTQSFHLFQSVLKYIERIRSEDDFMVLFPTLFFLFLLGWLHAIGPGHSKGFMAGYILSHGVSYIKSVGYAAIFTMIHLADIVIITLLAKFVLYNFDTSAYFSQIQQYSSVLLLTVAFIFLIKSLWQYGRGPSQITNASSSWGLWMAFFAGLAPCTFAWSILLVLFAIGRLDLAFPFVLAFGLGVFSALAVVATLIFHLRERVLGWGKGVVYILPIFSSVLLLVLASFLVYRVFW